MNIKNIKKQSLSCVAPGVIKVVTRIKMSLSAPCIIRVDGELNAALRVVTSGRDARVNLW